MKTLITIDGFDCVGKTHIIKKFWSRNKIYHTKENMSFIEKADKAKNDNSIIQVALKDIIDNKIAHHNNLIKRKEETIVQDRGIFSSYVFNIMQFDADFNIKKSKEKDLQLLKKFIDMQLKNFNCILFICNFSVFKWYSCVTKKYTNKNLNLYDLITPCLQQKSKDILQAFNKEILEFFPKIELIILEELL